MVHEIVRNLQWGPVYRSYVTNVAWHNHSTTHTDTVSCDILLFYYLLLLFQIEIVVTGKDNNIRGVFFYNN